MITFYGLTSDGYDELGTVNNGTVQGDESEFVNSLIETVADDDMSELPRIYDGPEIVAVDSGGDMALQDVEDIDTGDYPQAAVENARMALEAREDTGNPNDCGTQVGWERANQLVNGEDLSEETISRMAAFERHEDNADMGEEGEADCGWMMYKAWGGEEGISWAQDKLEEFEEARQNSSGDMDFSYMEPWERQLVEATWHAGENPDSKVLSFVDSTTPDFVKDRIRETILSGQALFSDIEGVSDSERMQLREFLTESLTSDGWTIDGVADQLMQLDSVNDRAYAELLAESETAGILNTSRMNGYEDQGMGEDLFYWSGAPQSEQPDRTTDACDWLIQKTNPFHNGNPVPKEELRDLIEEAPTHDPDMNDNLARPGSWMVHPRERKAPVRAPPEE